MYKNQTGKTDTLIKEHEMTQIPHNKKTKANEQHGLHQKLGAWTSCTGKGVSSAFLETHHKLLIKCQVSCVDKRAKENYETGIKFVLMVHYTVTIKK